MPLNYDALTRTIVAPVRQTYTRKDSILYALGLGVGAADPMDPGELKFVFERDLVALPTQVTVLGFDPIWFATPAFGITYSRILHAEQSLTVHRPLPPEGTVESEVRVDDVYDKGVDRGAILQMTRLLRDAASGELIATMGHAMFLRADGGFGGKSSGGARLRTVPADRPVDRCFNIQVGLNQALIYRLSGDSNPLHADPAMARKAGFGRPILHGLAAYGMVGRALIRHLCDDDPARMRRLDVRFTNPAYPGERLQIETWDVGPGDVAFRLVSADRGVVVEDCGRFEYD
jgi:hydroxyacyl-ACP dehydratase HTD2-like protein with hotdog domain